ncbi:hypothetical protein [Streptomyces flaveolus]|uniref:hypothetical protein n=1 Tax=Streptomyces flaveolus TaxID=67297 RepID=UPI0034395994
MTGPACGNNPNYRLSPGDQKAVDSFRAYLAARATLNRVRTVLETEAVAGRSALEYRGLIAAALMADDAPPAVLPATTDQTTTPSPAVHKALRRWAYAAGHNEQGMDDAARRMYELVARDVRRMADEAQPAPIALATPCADCRHTYNWHASTSRCLTPDCTCGQFQQPATAERQDGAQQ